VALQLTNILRDLREDAGRGRLYLPTDELAMAGVTLKSVRKSDVTEPLRLLLREYVDRAESYYKMSNDLEGRITANCRPTLATMTQIYHRLLERISADPTAVLRRRISLPLWSKLAIAWRATH
jgi:phytoene synthase